MRAHTEYCLVWYHIADIVNVLISTCICCQYLHVQIKVVVLANVSHEIRQILNIFESFQRST